jgi:DNA-binding GntR family transcriptional regulator
MAMRFVEVVPHKGARVRQIKRREVLEIYPVRAALEELAGNLAAENVSEHLGELEEFIARMTEAFDAGDHRQMVKWDVEFHRTILEATGNQVLIETWNSLMIEARTFVTLRKLMATQPNLDLAARHRPIIDALREGDPKHTGAVMRSHVEEFGAVMHDIFKNEEPEDFGEKGLSDETTEQPHRVHGLA